MSVRHGLLALLAEQPRHGYELRAEFERRTGSAWPLNVGQVYTTLARLERDGSVRSEGENDAGQKAYAVTPAGLDELAAWFATPVRREDRPRDELAVKLALAVTAPGVDVAAVLQAQRTDSLRALQDYTRLTRTAAGDLAWSLVLDALIFSAEAEVRWLDHCEGRLVAARAAGPAPAPAVSRPVELPLEVRS
jgi:DNA-binding PadR family transcriptional regulator